MKQYEFETNMKCENCLKTVTEAVEEDSNLTVVSSDLSSPKKKLTIEDQVDRTPDHAIELIQKAGFEAKIIKKGLFNMFR